MLCILLEIMYQSLESTNDNDSALRYDDTRNSDLVTV